MKRLVCVMEENNKLEGKMKSILVLKKSWKATLVLKMSYFSPDIAQIQNSAFFSECSKTWNEFHSPEEFLSFEFETGILNTEKMKFEMFQKIVEVSLTLCIPQLDINPLQTLDDAKDRRPFCVPNFSLCTCNNVL